MSSWRDSDNDNIFVKGVLWELLPAYHQDIAEVEEDERPWMNTPGEVSMYTVVSEVFLRKAFKDLLSTGELDSDLAQTCSNVIEELLGSGRPAVLDLVSLRVTDYLLGYIEPWLRFKSFAGPLLVLEVEDRKQYYTGPF
ncbi:hypothetical protein ACWDGI_43395 [Streptomyces sp. NPDC001220]